ncbi:MAG: hypothetical protein P4L76_13350 [Beijerinckiaceae bacterium]|nr:hypothetical protein [Beijerinckiaceae bacterium]
MKSDLLDLAMILHSRTDRAVRVSDDGDLKKSVWLPLSQCEVSPEAPGRAVTITLPEWLAIEKRLV